jgi:hypothetical protein
MSGTITSNISDLLKMEQEYKNLLLQYNETYENYIIAIKDTTQKLFTAKLSKYAGLTELGTSTSEVTAGDCLKKCKDKTTPLCTAANYNSFTKNCALYNNVNNLPYFPGGENDIAIFTSDVDKLKANLDELNMKLVEKNTDIFALIKSSETMYQNDRTKMEGKTKELEENYKQLYNQQQNVNKVLLEFESYIEKDVSTKKEANRNYIIYVLLFFILIVILLILIKTVII